MLPLLLYPSFLGSLSRDHHYCEYLPDLFYTNHGYASINGCICVCTCVWHLHLVWFTDENGSLLSFFSFKYIYIYIYIYLFSLFVTHGSRLFTLLFSLTVSLQLCHVNTFRSCLTLSCGYITIYWTVPAISVVSNILLSQSPWTYVIVYTCHCICRIKY